MLTFGNLHFFVLLISFFNILYINKIFNCCFYDFILLLCGKEIIAESRDFVMTGKQSIIAEYKKFWKTEHNKQNLSRQYRIVHNEGIAERDMTYYTHSTEVSEAEFMAELSKK